MNDFAPLSWLDMLGRLALAVALGASIGMERELSEKAAGLRTNMLVALGSTLFIFGTHSKWTGPAGTFGSGANYSGSDYRGGLYRCRGDFAKESNSRVNLCRCRVDFCQPGYWDRFGPVEVSHDRGRAGAGNFAPNEATGTKNYPEPLNAPGVGFRTGLFSSSPPVDWYRQRSFVFNGFNSLQPAVSNLPPRRICSANEAVAFSTTILLSRYKVIAITPVSKSGRLISLL